LYGGAACGFFVFGVIWTWIRDPSKKLEASFFHG
jgi:hypothetical protein